MSSSTIQDRLACEITPERYRHVRALWVTHSKAEDARDLARLISTLAPDCVYEIVPTGQRWEGHVIEVTRMTGTHVKPWAGANPTGRAVDLDVIIHFPWDPQHEKFAGERIYFDRAALAAAIEG